MFLIVFNELHVVRLFYKGFLFLHVFRKCTVSSILLEGFSWAKAEKHDQVRCKLDNRVFRISHYRFDLKQHEETQLHKKTLTARAATPDIRTATSSQTDCQRLEHLLFMFLIL